MRDTFLEEVVERLDHAGDRVPPASKEEPIRLGWTDPESLDELVVEAWGAEAFLSELLSLGFVVRQRSRGETSGPHAEHGATCVDGTGAGDRMGEACTGAPSRARGRLALRARRLG